MSNTNQASDNSAPSEIVKLRDNIADGLVYVHARLAENTTATLEAKAFLYALIEILIEKNVISIEELDERKHAVAQRLEKKKVEDGVGVLVQQPELDKYTFDGESKIDCASRVHLCKAACCRLPFALSKQDIHEGIIRWDLGHPYIIAQDNAGYCCHLERVSQRCSIRDHRPVPCRAYDCSKDKSIWLDFEKMTINPEIYNADWPRSIEPPQDQGSET